MVLSTARIGGSQEVSIMTETQVPQSTEPRSLHTGGARRVAARGAAVAGILIGMLIAAEPTWAGPIMGC